MRTDRTCGACTECCKTHPISELKKRAGKWCRFRMKEHGCSVYEKRPKGCVEFECQWLKGHGAESDRPDRTGIVIDFLMLGLIGRTMVLWEGRERLDSEYGKTLAAHYISLEHAVLQRFLSGKEVLLVPHALQIPPEKLQAFATDKRRVLIVGVYS